MGDCVQHQQCRRRASPASTDSGEPDLAGREPDSFRSRERLDRGSNAFTLDPKTLVEARRSFASVATGHADRWLQSARQMT